MLTTEMMTVDQWIVVTKHPRQRDTDKRAEYAKTRHLAELKDAHLVVYAIKWHGHLYKIDGHTRALLWSQGELKRPKFVTVIIFTATTEEEYLNAYEWFDGRGPLKDSADYCYGACNSIGLSVTSGLLKKYKFSTQLRRAAMGAKGSWVLGPIYGIVYAWREELRILDGFDLSGKNPFIIGVALKLIREHNGDSRGKVREFFTKVNNDQGTKSSRGRDGIQMLCEFIGNKQASQQTSGHRNWDDMDLEISRAFKQWMDDRWNKTGRRVNTAHKEESQSSDDIL